MWSNNKRIVLLQQYGYDEDNDGDDDDDDDNVAQYNLNAFPKCL